MKYNWQQSDWPNFRYDASIFEGLLTSITRDAAFNAGALSALPEVIKAETIIDLMLSEAINTSQIEGEYLNREDVRSSICKNLGFETATQTRRELSTTLSPRAQAIARLLSDVRSSFRSELSCEKLFTWHRILMTGAISAADVGCWRTSNSPMQVISGSMGKGAIHFVALPSEEVPREMERFIYWYNLQSSSSGRDACNLENAREEELNLTLHPAIHSAIAHLYFESIHPFEDGNGRLGRAISEHAFFQRSGSPVLLSLSKSIEKRKKDYYNSLERAQTSNEITEWINYFLNIILDAQKDAKNSIDFVIEKSRYFERYNQNLSDRQLKVVRKMFDLGVEGFEGGMTARKYISLTKVSKATATRDLLQLEELGALTRTGEGRSTRYILPIKAG